MPAKEEGNYGTPVMPESFLCLINTAKYNISTVIFKAVKTVCKFETGFYICPMRSFNYQYKGETVESLWAASVENGDLCYKVKLGTDLWLTIVPTFISSSGDKIIWLQSVKEHEIVQPHDLVQAMGEGIEIYIEK